MSKNVHFQFLVLRFYFSSVSVAFPMTKKNPKGLKNIFAFKRGNNFNLLRSVCICITLHHKHLHLKWFKSVAFMFLWASCWPAQPQLLSLPMSWVMCHLCETLIISPPPPSWLCVCVCRGCSRFECASLCAGFDFLFIYFASRSELAPSWD